MIQWTQFNYDIKWIFNGYCIDSQKKKETVMEIFQCKKSCGYITFLTSSIEFHTSLKTHQWWNERLKEREKDDVKLVYEIHWINLQCSVLYIGRTEAGKDETKITYCLINLSCTRGIRDNKTHYLYIPNGSRLWLSKLSYCSLALHLQNYNASILPLKMNHRCWLGSS